MPTVTVNGLNMYYEQVGKGPDLVLISGLSADHQTWSRVLPLLEANYRVLIFDNRGAGQTDAPDVPSSIADMAADTAGLMRQLGINKAHILGQSMGSYIAARLALDMPEIVNRLILVSSGARTTAQSAYAIQMSLKLAAAGIDRKLLIENSVTLLFGAPILQDVTRIAAYVAYKISNPHQQTLHGFNRQIQAIQEHDIQNELAHITMPTLVIAGEQDLIQPVKNANYLVEHLPRAELITLRNVGHVPQHEAPELFVSHVQRFLGSVIV